MIVGNIIYYLMMVGHLSGEPFQAGGIFGCPVSLSGEPFRELVVHSPLRALSGEPFLEHLLPMLFF